MQHAVTLSSKLGLGSPPGAVRVTPDERTLLVTVNAAKTLEVIDTETLSTRSVIGVQASPMGIAVPPDSKAAYVANTGIGTVSIVDLVAGRVLLSFPVGKGPEFLIYALGP